MNLPAHELNQTWKKFETHVSFKQLVKITKVFKNDFLDLVIKLFWYKQRNKKQECVIFIKFL